MLKRKRVDLNIALDAMGGDNAPGQIVEGALWAASEYGVNITLVGDRGLILKSLEGKDFPEENLKICHCSQAIAMHEAPLKALRKKRDASISVSFKKVKDGEADAVVSAGNSGATVGAAILTLGKVTGIERPGLAGIFPGARGDVILIDVGASVDARPRHLLDFGIMGTVFYRSFLNMDNPRVGLLSIGQEGGKGNEKVRVAYNLFEKGPVNFAGNVEGGDIFSGDIQVIASDGFVGNVALKLAEGMADAVGNIFEREMSRDAVSRLSFWLGSKAFKNFKRHLDYEEYGGAPLLGVKGTGIVCHGNSSPKAIKNAVGTAIKFVNDRIQKRILKGMEEYKVKGY